MIERLKKLVEEAPPERRPYLLALQEIAAWVEPQMERMPVKDITYIREVNRYVSKAEIRDVIEGLLEQVE